MSAKFDISASVHSLIEYASTSRGDLIARFAELLHDARENGFTNQQVIDHILAAENGDALGSESMLKKYAQVIDIATGLDLATPVGYAQTWIAYSRASRVKGADIPATFKSVASAKTPAKKLKALAGVNAETVVIKKNGGNASKSAPKSTPKSSPVAETMPITAVKLAQGLLASLKSDTLTTSEFEKVVAILSDIDEVINKKMA